MKNRKHIPTFESFVSKIDEGLSSESDIDARKQMSELHKIEGINKSRTLSDIHDKVKSILDSITEKYPDILQDKGSAGQNMRRYEHIANGIKYFNDNTEEVLAKYINEVKNSIRGNSTVIDPKSFAKDLVKNMTIKVWNMSSSLDDLNVLIELDDKTKVRFFGDRDPSFPRTKIKFGDGLYRKIGGDDAMGRLVVYFGEATKS
jgi:hypothetical protein